MGLVFNQRGVRLLALSAAALALAGGVAYATIPDSQGVYTACMLKNVGTIRLIDPSLPDSNPMSHCTTLETKVTFNKQGPQGLPGAPGQDGTPGAPGQNGTPGANGKDGTSVTSSSLPAGDPNCANGGSSFTAANSTTYACNGAPGANGKDGKDGADTMTARINNIGTGREAWGPVSGVSSSCFFAGCEAELSPNSPTVAQDFAVRLTNPATSEVDVGLDVNDIEYFICIVQTGQTTCTSSGTRSIPAASPFDFNLQGDFAALPGGDALIGWRLTTQ